MAKNNEKQAKVKEKRTTSIEFISGDGVQDGVRFAMNIIPVELNLNASKTSIKVLINYFSSNKTAVADGDIIGTYTVKANIHSILEFPTQEFMEIMKTGRKYLKEMGYVNIINESVEIVDLISESVSDKSVGLDQIKTRIEQKLMGLNISAFEHTEIVITTLNTEVVGVENQ